MPETNEVSSIAARSYQGGAFSDLHLRSPISERRLNGGKDLLPVPALRARRVAHLKSREVDGFAPLVLLCLAAHRLLILEA